MSDEPTGARPPRMHGITPTPYEIPAEHRRESTRTGLGLPLFIKVTLGFTLLRAVVYLLLALVPWSDPDSAVAGFFIARPEIVFGAIPRVFQPCVGMSGLSVGRMVEGLPFIFLGAAGLYLFSAWKLVNLDKFWISIIRWVIMFQSGATVVKLMIALSARFVGAAEAPLSDAMRLAIILTVFWNLIIFGCFAFFPRIEDAYDTKI